VTNWVAVRPRWAARQSDRRRSNDWHLKRNEPRLCVGVACVRGSGVNPKILDTETSPFRGAGVSVDVGA